MRGSREEVEKREKGEGGGRKERMREGERTVVPTPNFISY